jgi:hypothetical protein
MQNKKADQGNWQARGQEFQVGQTVKLINGGDTDQGRVIAVWPGIGMVDIQWPHTSYRMPVEDLQIVNPGDDQYISPMHEDVPGGAGTDAFVSEGAPATNWIDAEVPRVELVQEVDTAIVSRKVAKQFVKQSLYWHARDRKYRISRDEHTSGQYRCPARTCEGHLRKATYKMDGGSLVKCHACPSCLFIIRTADMVLADGGGC